MCVLKLFVAGEVNTRPFASKIRHKLLLVKGSARIVKHCVHYNVHFPKAVLF